VISLSNRAGKKGRTLTSDGAPALPFISDDWRPPLEAPAPRAPRTRLPRSVLHFRDDAGKRARVRTAALAPRGAKLARGVFDLAIQRSTHTDKFRRDTESLLVTHPLRHHSRANY